MEIIIRDLQRKLENVKGVTSDEEEDNFDPFAEVSDETPPSSFAELEQKESKEKLKGDALLNNIEWFINKEIFPLFDDVRTREDKYNLVYNSAAFVALRYNLSDFIGNCYDAGATEIKITIPENKDLINGRVAITLSDNGKGFPPSMLPTNEEKENMYGKKYSEILNGKTQINSDKKAQGLGGHGGAGLGLARASLFLAKKDGDIHLSQNNTGPGAKITLESEQPQGILDNHTRLAAGFGKIKDQQIRKIARAEEENFKNKGVVFFDDESVDNPSLSPDNHSEITNLDGVTSPASPTLSSNNNFDVTSPSSALSDSQLSDFGNTSPSSVGSNSELSDFDVINTPASHRIEDKQQPIPESNLTQKILSSLEDLESTFKRVNSTNKAAITQLTIENIRDVNNNEGFTPSQKIQEMQKLLEDLNSKISPQGGSVAGLSFFSSHKVVTALIKQVKEEHQFRTKEELENNSSSKPTTRK